VTSFYIYKRIIKNALFAFVVLSMLLQSSCTQLNFGAKASGDGAPPSASPTSETTIQPSAASQSPTSVSPSPEATKPAGPDVPERTATTDDYFSDAAFMGNSLMDGFRLFSGLTTCDYYAATSMTVVGADSKYCIKLNNGNSGTLVDGLIQKPYGKIYILLGVNEIGSNIDTFIDQYGKMLDKIIAAQPNCKIYIMSLTPVSAVKSASSDIFNMTRINQYNTALHQLAADKGCYYIDLVSALAGTDGYLPSSVTSDGVHFAAPEYKVWLDYLRTHYV